MSNNRFRARIVGATLAFSWRALNQSGYFSAACDETHLLESIYLCGRWSGPPFVVFEPRVLPTTLSVDTMTSFYLTLAGGDS